MANDAKAEVPATADLSAIPSVTQLMDKVAQQQQPRNCGNCAFSRRVFAQNHLDCRYESPKVFVVPTPKGAANMSAWPTTRAELWCGKHQPRE